VIGDESIARMVADGIGNSPAVLLKNHGGLVIGRSAEAAVKPAVMVKDVARTAWPAQ